jgi:hypothetical protein
MHCDCRFIELAKLTTPIAGTAADGSVASKLQNNSVDDGADDEKIMIQGVFSVNHHSQ